MWYSKYPDFEFWTVLVMGKGGGGKLGHKSWFWVRVSCGIFFRSHGLHVMKPLKGLRILH
jgi:hypothetical protein